MKFLCRLFFFHVSMCLSVDESCLKEFKCAATVFLSTVSEIRPRRQHVPSKPKLIKMHMEIFPPLLNPKI